MCACLAPKWAGLVGRSAALCHEEGGGGRGAALRWPLTDPRNKKLSEEQKKNSIDVQLFPTRRSPAVLNIVRTASLSVRRFHLARHLCRWGGGRGVARRESTWDEMMSTQDSSDVYLWTAEATYRNRQRCFFLTDIKLDMHTHTPTLNRRY